MNYVTHNRPFQKKTKTDDVLHADETWNLFNIKPGGGKNILRCIVFV
jgi:hypothetical protein